MSSRSGWPSRTWRWVRTNRSHPLLAIEIRSDCVGVPDGYEDPDGRYDDLWDDYRTTVDPDGEQRDEPLDPPPSS